MEETIVILTKEQAKEMIADGPRIHTFRGFVGADWTRKQVLKAIEKYECQLTGPIATSMGHGLGFYDEHGWVFVATKETE
jgi:hypothetical protein